MKHPKFDRQTAVALGAAAVASRLLRQWQRNRKERKGLLAGKRVLIVGGSRGLGLALAQVYCRLGASVILSARNMEELGRAKALFLPQDADVEIHACDITDPDQTTRAVRAVTESGPIEVLVNDAGIMEVGPLETFDLESFRRAIDTNLLGMIRMSLETLPHMREGSRIVNITSIGGAISVPHLLPYSVSKFGALGFSLGLQAEVARRGIVVTTVLPGLMRTGSFVQAEFRGDARKEFAWFALGAATPGLSMSAERAARQIVRASLEGRRFLVLSPHAKLARLLYTLFPEGLLALMRVVARALPGSDNGIRGIQGKELKRGAGVGLSSLGDRAVERLNEDVA
jgi:NAD(P)-dependent dehydrogenase (short-subunit alcohol dehydrogenase family)